MFLLLLKCLCCGSLAVIAIYCRFPFQFNLAELRMRWTTLWSEATAHSACLQAGCGDILQPTGDNPPWKKSVCSDTQLMSAQETRLYNFVAYNTISIVWNAVQLQELQTTGSFTVLLLLTSKSSFTSHAVWLRNTQKYYICCFYITALIRHSF